MAPMESKPNRLGSPNLRLIERSLKNSFYEDEDIIVTLNTSVDNDQNTFEISLTAKKKQDETLFRIETRIALEQHTPTHKHQYPHLQIHNFASDEELLKKGKLYITLLVQTIEELEECCNGFIYNISEILDSVEKAFNKKINLKEFFFYLEPLDKLGEFSNKLHELIYLSFKTNKLIFEEQEMELVEFKSKKNEPKLDTKDLFKILRILLSLKFLNPVLLGPIFKLIKEDPKVKMRCPSLDYESWKQILTSKDPSELKYYNKEKFIKEFSTI